MASTAVSARLSCVLIALAASTTLPSPSLAEGDRGDRSDAAATGFFESRVRPLLESRCLKCHGRDPKVRGNLRLDSREAILRGGDLGPAVTPDSPEESPLLQAIRYEGLEMPPSGKLPQAEIDVLSRWVKQGIPWPGEGRKAPGSITLPPSVASSARPSGPERWVYHAVKRPAVPPTRNREWVRNPIDAFILAGLESHDLEPVSPADRMVLIRRVTYDLTGLPPTPEEVDAFVSDCATDAYARLVDRLLASPRYGEAWGRHWLDLVRYAETNGYERDSAKPFAWRYRDYVIHSFNTDKPYDRFVREQLAGDEVNPNSAEGWIATGFYRLGIWDDEPADRPLARYDVLDGIVSTAGQVFLGLSINCARCHDHKKDPIPQRDYYRLLAFFNDITNQDGKNTRKLGTDGPEVMCVREEGHADTHVLLRGNPNLLGPKVEPGVPEVLGASATTFATGPGKRRALADWLTDRRNPMTARVLANRFWQYHFGRGIVPTPNDFGGLGEPPTHPELLDWLAAELMDGGWHMKRIHRMILLSNTYQMSSRATATNLARDPGNERFWRYPMRRLRAEEVRDAILAVSGRLNSKEGGPSIRPPIPREVLASQSMPGNGWSVSSPEESSRRSVYIHVKRSLLVPILATHDLADTDSSCPVRYTTTVPSQSLGLLNGQFANEHAGHFARRLRRERPGDIAGQVRRALRLTTGSTPADDEVAADVAWIRSVRAESGLTEQDALAQYCLMALNTNAFLYLD